MKVIKWVSIFIVFFVKLSVAQVSKTLMEDFMPSDGGMLYKIYNPSKSQKIQPGDFLIISGNQIDPLGKLIFSSYKTGRPSFFYCKTPDHVGDLFSALPFLSEGDSATIKLNVDTLIKYGAQKLDTYPNRTGNYLTYNIKVEKVIPKGKLTEEAFNERIQSFIEDENQKAKNLEPQNIQSYIQKHDISPSKTASGFYFMIHKQGMGIKAKTGDTVLVNYTGRYISGAVFDTSFENIAHIEGIFNIKRLYAPLLMSAGIGNFIEGFDESLLMFQEGSIYTIIVPSQLAFGSKGNTSFPPYTPVIFEIELIEVRPKK